jgi:hypothetical protein
MTPAIPLQTPGAETASNQFLPSFSNLDLQGYLHLHPHPAYILPSPRLSSSSSPSLSPLYSNPAALDLSPNLEPIIIEGDRKRLKRLIASHDQELDDALFGSSDQDPIDTDSLASYNSFEGRGGNGSGSMDDVLEIQLFLPVWSTKRPYTAILVSSPHPSFLVLHLHPTFYRSTSKSALNRRRGRAQGVPFDARVKDFGRVAGGASSPAAWAGTVPCARLAKPDGYGGELREPVAEGGVWGCRRFSWDRDV